MKTHAVSAPVEIDRDANVRLLSGPVAMPVVARPLVAGPLAMAEEAMRANAASVQSFIEVPP
jgi:hypothetical protein